MNEKREVYLDNGRRASVEAEVDGKFLVYPMYRESYDPEGDIEESYWDQGCWEAGELQLVDRVFDEAPVAAYADEIEILRQQAADLREGLSGIRDEIRIATGERRELVKKLEQVPTLRRLVAHMENKVTHYVTFHWGGDISVVTAVEVIGNEDKYDASSRKLLTLFGRTGGDFEWSVNDYSDGSGSWGKEVIPCISIEEARRRAGEILTERMAGLIEDQQEEWVESADRLGVAVPDMVRKYHQASRRESLEEQVGTAEKRLIEAKGKLAAAP